MRLVQAGPSRAPWFRPGSLPATTKGMAAGVLMPAPRGGATLPSKGTPVRAACFGFRPKSLLRSAHKRHGERSSRQNK